MVNVDPCLRARLFSALATGFERPRNSTVQTVPENSLLSALADAGQALPGTPFMELFERLWALVERPDVDTALRQLEVEYARLFLVPSQERILPNEHVYVRRSLAELTGDLFGSYREFGLNVAPAFKDLADHIAIELEFLAHLLSVGNKTEAQAFFEVHLSEFARRCAGELRARARSEYYEIVADSLAACVELESSMYEGESRLEKQR